MLLDRFYSPEARRKKALKKASGPVKDYLAVATVPTRTPLEEIEFVSLDLEATGLDVEQDEILSVGYVLIKQMNIQLGDSAHNLVAANQSVPEQTAIIHQITDDKRESGVPLQDVIEEVLEVLKGRVLLAHNANIECQFLASACKKLYGCELVIPTVDTYAIEYRSLKHRGITPANNQLRLYNLRKDYGLPRYKAHNALYDALATAELFLAQVAKRRGSGSMSLKEVLAHC